MSDELRDLAESQRHQPTRSGSSRQLGFGYALTAYLCAGVALFFAAYALAGMIRISGHTRLAPSNSSMIVWFLLFGPVASGIGLVCVVHSWDGHERKDEMDLIGIAITTTTLVITLMLGLAFFFLVP